MWKCTDIFSVNCIFYRATWILTTPLVYSNQLRVPGMLEHFSLLLFNKIEFCFMTLYDAFLGFVAMEKEEAHNVLMHLLNVVETMKQNN